MILPAIAGRRAGQSRREGWQGSCLRCPKLAWSGGVDFDGDATGSFLGLKPCLDPGKKSKTGEYAMTSLLKSCQRGPDWPEELSIPDWFRERAEALIGKLGEDHPDSKAFRQILTTGRIEEKAVDYLDFVSGKTNNEETILLAIDISHHCFATIKVMSMIPYR
jgi:hypothetical protein